MDDRNAASPEYGQSQSKFDKVMYENYSVPEETSTLARKTEMNKPFVSEEKVLASSSLKEKPGYHYVHGTGLKELKIPIGEDAKFPDPEASKNPEEVQFAQNLKTPLLSFKKSWKTPIPTPKVSPNATPPPGNKTSQGQQPNEANHPKPTEAGERVGSQSNAQPTDHEDMEEIPAQTDPKGLVPESHKFRDGKREIDLVLVFEENAVMTVMEGKRRQFRKTFQHNLMKEGLELELEHKSLSFDGKTWFLKIHIPLETQKRIADAIKLKLLIKRLISISATSRVEKDQAMMEERELQRKIHKGERQERQASRGLHQAHRDDRAAKRREKPVNIDEKQAKIEREQAELDAKQTKSDRKQAKADEKEAKREEEEAKRDEIKAKRIAAKLARKQAKRDMVEAEREQREKPTRNPYWYEKMYMKMSTRWRRLLEDEFSFYAAHQDGVRRVEQFLVKERYTEFSSAQRSLLAMQILLRAHYDTSKMGIRRLLSNNTYRACFPLHDGKYDSDRPDGSRCDRRLLYLEWARPSNWYKAQPLWLIRRYFGSKIGLYFCWLGFYTWMLVLPAVIGTMCFVYGILTLETSPNAVNTHEICNETGPGNITLCPLCDNACRYQKLSESCGLAKLSYLFDNPATVFFSVFMAFWATSFLELWKRRSAVLRWEWDLIGIEDYEEPRAEFEESVKTFIVNPVTRVREPHMPSWEKVLRQVATTSAVLFMIALVLGAVLGIIVYQLSMVLVIYRSRNVPEIIKDNVRLLNSIIAALLNLVVIFILSKIYRKIAVHLVNMENPRTQTEFNDSYAFKIFIFECVNYYSSLVYIAFFKGLFYDHPGDCEARRSEFFLLKGDICDPTGCLTELCITLAIVMVGKQFILNFIDFVIPWIRNLWRRTTQKYMTLDQSKPLMTWETDYRLPSPKRMVMFNDTLKLIIQYGFVTLFVAAFPLAPLFALINNIIEIRLEAFRLLTTARRPLAELVDDLGAWSNILKGITYFAVITNAFVIAYTSSFLPCMVYKYAYSPDFSLVGYINHSLSWFNTSDYLEEWGYNNEADPPLCAYIGYRNPPDHPERYSRGGAYWHVFAARLAFVIIFEHLIFGLTALIKALIPDVPRTLKMQLQREAMISKEERFDNKARVEEFKKLIAEKVGQPKEHRVKRRKPPPKMQSLEEAVHGLNTLKYD